MHPKDFDNYTDMCNYEEADSEAKMISIDVKLTKDEGLWLSECESLDLMTQGHSRDEAITMMISMISDFCGDGSKLQETKIIDNGSNIVEVCFVDIRAVLPYFLKLFREQEKLTQAQVAESLGVSSVTNYARYEQGNTHPTVDALSKLLDVMGGRRLKVVG